MSSLHKSSINGVPVEASFLYEPFLVTPPGKRWTIKITVFTKIEFTCNDTNSIADTDPTIVVRKRAILSFVVVEHFKNGHHRSGFTFVPDQVLHLGAVDS
jgi:hypothetical protein